MLLSYVLKLVFRNSRRTALMMSGIVVIATVFSSVVISTNRLTYHKIQEPLQNIPYDARMLLDNNDYNNESFEELASRLEVSQSLDFVEDTTFARVGVFENLKINSAKDIPINWTSLEQTNESNSEIGFEHGIFYGIDFSNENIAAFFENFRVFSKTIQIEEYNITLLNQGGVLLEQEFMSTQNLQVGDFIEIGAFSEVRTGANPGNCTGNISNVVIAGKFSFLDLERFAESIQFGYGNFYFSDTTKFKSQDMLILGNLSNVQEKSKDILHQMEAKTSIEDMALKNPKYWLYFIQYNYDKLVLTDMIRISVYSQQIYEIQIQVNIDYGYGASLNNYMFDLVQNSSDIGLILEFSFFMIPVFILSLIIAKNIYSQIFEQRRREIGLYKLKSATNWHLFRFFLLEAVIIGVLGILMGIFLGNGLSSIVYSNIFMGQSISLLDFTAAFFTFQFISTSFLVGMVIFGIIFMLITSFRIIRRYLKIPVRETLEEFNFEQQQIKPKHKKGLFILFSLGLISSIIGARPSWLYTSDNSLGPFMSILEGISNALIPFAGILLVYTITKIVCDGSIKRFTKLVTRTSKLFDKTLSKYTINTILNNQKRAVTAIFLISLTLSITLTTTVVYGSETRFHEKVRTLEYASGNINKYRSNAQIYTPILTIKDLVSEINLINETYASSSKGLIGSSLSSLVYDKNGNEITKPLEESYQTEWKLGGFSVDYFSNLEMDAKWFEGDSYNHMFERLASENNTVIAPTEIQELGFQLNDLVEIRLKDFNQTIFQRNYTIVGYYNDFPTIRQFYNPLVLCDLPQIDFLISEFVIILQGESTPTSTELTNYLQENGMDVSLSDSESIDEANVRFGTISGFLKFQLIYLVFMVIMVVILVGWITIQEKNHIFSLLRARGISMQTLFLLQNSEIMILSVLGLSFSLLGLFSGPSMLTYNENILYISNYARTFIIPWGLILGMLVLVGILFFAAVGLIFKINARRSEIGKIAEILRIKT